MSGLRLQFAEWVAASRTRPMWLRAAVAILFPVLALLLTLQIPDLKDAPFFPIFTVVVAGVAVYAGASASVLAVTVSVLLNAIFVIDVRGAIAIGEWHPFIRLAIYAVAGLVLATLTGILTKVQAELESERERLISTLQCIGDGVIVTDANGCVHTMNPVAQELTGWTIHEARGLPLESIFVIENEYTRAAVDNPVRKVLHSGRIVGLANHTVLIRRDGSEIPIDDSAAPVTDGKGAVFGVVLVFRDMTERKRTERALIDNEKLATVGKLASTIAHEINNPLEAVVNLLFLARHTPGTPPETSAYLEIADKELARMAEVARQALSFSRHDQTRGVTDIGRLVAEVAGLYEHRLRGKNVSLEVRARNSESAVVSGSELRQVVANLLTNAIDAVGSDGSVFVRTSAYGGGEYVRITVADSGTGMAPDVQKKIFAPFFTTKKHIGTGLGLWIAQSIAESHGGSIRMRSRAGMGSVFWLLIPTTDNAAEGQSAD